MNSRGKKGTSKTAAFETAQVNKDNNALEDIRIKNHYWSSYIYQLLLAKEFIFTDNLVDILTQEIGIVRTSRIFDLALLLLERNYFEIFNEYKLREGLIFTEQ